MFISGAKHVPPVAVLIQEKMEDMMDWYRNEASNFNAIERGAMLHTLFVGIHPFIDGNGRTARLLRLYTHKDYQGRGIATMLLKKLEDVAKKAGITEIYTDASVTAKSFFENCGYEIIMYQNVERNGVLLSNFKMHKTLFQN